MTRAGTIERDTAKTHIRVGLELDGSGAGERATGVGFFDHMLDLLARHAHMDLTVEATGDLQTGACKLLCPGPECQRGRHVAESLRGSDSRLSRDATT